MTPRADDGPDPLLEGELDLLFEVLGVKIEKSRLDGEGGGWIRYNIPTRAGLDLRVEFELYSDQLNVTFNGSYLSLEAVAHMRKFRRNPSTFDQWRGHALICVRNILTSDLTVVTYSRWGRLLAGFLYRWDGQKWECCGGGGNVPLLFGNRMVSEYPAWLAKQTDVV